MSAIASLAASSTSMTEETRPIEEIVQEICGLPTDLLGRISKQAVDEMGRRAKMSTKSKKAPKKTGSMPKGRVPDQLRKPREWVNHVKADAIANGWPSYTMHQARKNKETGEKEEEEIEMPASEQNAEGAHVFEGSITEKLPKGRAFTHKDAMSLSAVYWKVKTQKGTRQDLYEEFDASYQEEDTVSEASDSEKVVVRMTAAEKETQKAEKAAAAAATPLPGLTGSAFRLPPAADVPSDAPNEADRDYGNDMEHRMILAEQLGDVLDSDDPSIIDPIAKEIDEIDAFWAKIRTKA